MEKMDRSEKVKSGPRSRTCHICNQSCLISGYLGHLNQCKKRFLSEQALLPLHERRRLPPDPLFKEGQPTTAELEILNDYSKNIVKTEECPNCGRSFEQAQLFTHQRGCIKENPSTSRPTTSSSGRPTSAPSVRAPHKKDAEITDEDLSKTAPLDISRPNSFARLVSLKDSFRANMGRKILGRNSVVPLQNQTESGDTLTERLKERSARIDAVNEGVKNTIEGLGSINTTLSGMQSEEKRQSETRESVSSLTDLRMKLNSRGGSRPSPSHSIETYSSMETLRKLETRTASIETALLALLQEVREVRSIITTDLSTPPPPTTPVTPPRGRYRQTVSPSTPLRHKADR